MQDHDTKYELQTFDNFHLKMLAVIKWKDTSWQYLNKKRNTNQKREDIN